ncbi:MAG: polysaccharide deacetylase family protein, partial [Armatimonadetes bacterium]|nr:polysaccharide deacetylase family protein [Armatimonadota bacterium]
SRPRVWHWAVMPLPRAYESPTAPSVLRAVALPHLGPDPLALPLVTDLRRHNPRLDPRPIDPVARLAHVPVMMYHDVVQGEKGVWFDLAIEEFEQDLARLEAAGATPISLRQWWAYITRGEELPKKPILLTFDDGYDSVYKLIYPRLKQRKWPAVFFIVTSTVGRRTGKDHLTWDQMREMRATGLFEFQAHTVTHPYLTQIPVAQMERELIDCRATLERELGSGVQFLCYPIGDRNAEVIRAAKNAGYVAGFTMTAGGSAQSDNIMEVNRYPNQEIATAIEQARGEMTIAVPPAWPKPDLSQPVAFHREVVQAGRVDVPLCWVAGGRLTSVHADYRYAVSDVARLAGAVGGINGGFFQLAHVRDISNAMLGPVMAAQTTTRDEAMWRETTVAEPATLLAYDRFIPGAEADNRRLQGRPLVLISPTSLRFVPFDHQTMNSRRALELIQSDVTDAFVAGGWLVRDGRALTAEEMDLVATGDHDDARRRAFVGIDRQGRPVIGASPSSQSSERIARCLEQLQIAQAALLDSGFSSSLYYNGSIFVSGHSDAKPSRPVPHILLLHDPNSPGAAALGPTITKVEAMLRSAQDNNQSDLMPPNARLVDQPVAPE